MKKETAVELLFERIFGFLRNAENEGIYEVGTQNVQRWLEIFKDEAKELEKQQIIDFADEYEKYCFYTNLNNRHIQIKSAEQYYDETYE